MPKRPFKFKLLLDENMPTRKYLPLVNKTFGVKHISADLKHIGLSDPDVYEIARKSKRLIVTYNAKDFRKLAKLSDNTGIIGVSANITLDQIDKKLTALLTKSSKKELFGSLTYISGES